MKVRMVAFLSGNRNGVPWPGPGGTVDLPDDEAREMCERGYARPEPETRTEKHEDSTVETRAAKPESGKDRARH